MPHLCLCAKSLCSFTHGTHTVTTLGSRPVGGGQPGSPLPAAAVQGQYRSPRPSGERSRAPLPDRGGNPHFSGPGAATAQLRSRPANYSRGSWTFPSVWQLGKGPRPGRQSPPAHGVQSWEPLEMGFLRGRRLSVPETSSRKVVALGRPHRCLGAGPVSLPLPSTLP